MSEVHGKRRKDPRPDDFSFPKFKAPTFTEAQLVELDKAAKAYATRHASDPFAYGRIFLHMKRGIVTTDEVKSDSRMSSSLE